VPAHPPVAAQAVKAAVGGAEPDVAVRRAGDRPDVVARHLRMGRAVVPGELVAVDVEHGQARAGGAHPYPIGGVDEYRPDEVVAQPLAHAPDAEADAVVSREPVARGDPEVALAILRDGIDAIGGQAVEHADLARLRKRRATRGPR